MTKDKEKLKKLEKHIKRLEAVDLAREKGRLEKKLNKLQSNKILISFRVNNELYMNILKACKKSKKPKSEYVRDILIKELKGGIKCKN